MLKRSFLSVAVVAGLLAGASAPAQAQNSAVMRIINNSSHTVYHIYVSPTYRGDYGDRDVLGNRTIRPGRSLIVDFNVPDAENKCLLDIKAEGAGSRRWTRKIDVCEEASWTLWD